METAVEFVSRERQWMETASRFLKAELKRADVTYDELARRLREDHGLYETKHSVAAKIGRGTFPAAFFFASMKAVGKKNINLAEL